MRFLRDFAVALIIASASGFIAQRLWVGILVGAALLAVIAFLERRSSDASSLPRENPAASDLAAELRTGYAIQNKARLASPGTEDLFEACQAFIEWGAAMNDRLLAVAPEFYSELPQTAPFSITGKAKALEHMDERLRGHSEIVRRLKGDPPTSLSVQPRLSDVEVAGLEKRYWAMRESEEHTELSGLLERGLDLRASIETVKNDPTAVVSNVAFQLTPWPQKVQAWLKDAQLFIRKSKRSADFKLVRSYRTPSAALEALDATLEALGAIDEDTAP